MPPIFDCDLFVHFLRGFVEGGHHHVLQHLDIARHFGIDLHAEHVLVAVHLDGHHAAAGRSLHADRAQSAPAASAASAAPASSWPACCRAFSWLFSDSLRYSFKFRTVRTCASGKQFLKPLHSRMRQRAFAKLVVRLGRRRSARSGAAPSCSRPLRRCISHRLAQRPASDRLHVRVLSTTAASIFGALNDAARRLAARLRNAAMASALKFMPALRRASCRSCANRRCCACGASATAAAALRLARACAGALERPEARTCRRAKRRQYGLRLRAASGAAGAAGFQARPAPLRSIAACRPAPA